jgi:hypothetical protein
MSSKFITSTHPKNGDDVIIEYDEDYRFVNAVYTNDEDVEITPAIKSHFQSDIDTFIKN